MKIVVIDRKGEKTMVIDGAQTDPATIDRQLRDKDTALIGFKSEILGKGMALLVKENLTALLFVEDPVDI